MGHPCFIVGFTYTVISHEMTDIRNHARNRSSFHSEWTLCSQLFHVWCNAFCIYEYNLYFEVTYVNLYSCLYFPHIGHKWKIKRIINCWLFDTELNNTKMTQCLEVKQNGYHWVPLRVFYTWCLPDIKEKLDIVGTYIFIIRSKWDFV